MANTELERQRERESERERKTTVPSLTSLTPVAMPTIERETERGERESRVEGRRGGKVWMPA